MKSLHIAISGRAFAPETGGIREYSRAITQALLRLESPHRFTIYHSDESLVGLFPPAEEVFLSAPHKFVWDHGVLPHRLHQDQPDLVWFPQNVSSLGLKIPSVVSVADLLYFNLPGVDFREYPLLDTWYMRCFIPRSLRKARKIMAISEWTRQDIIKVLEIPEEKVHRIHLAASRNFHHVEDDEVRVMLDRFGFENPFFLYVGSLSVRKNVQGLLRAFAAVQNDVVEDLVITGVGPVKASPVNRLIDELGLAHRVHITGRVTDGEMVALYNAATAMVFPSRYEGFGIPPLEAFACGCPVISSNATSLAEVVGEAALTFDPLDTAGLQDHLLEVAGNETLREELRQRGREQGARFSYEKSARDLLALFEEAVA